MSRGMYIGGMLLAGVAVANAAWCLSIGNWFGFGLSVTAAAFTSLSLAVSIIRG